MKNTVDNFDLLCFRNVHFQAIKRCLHSGKFLNEIYKVQLQKIVLSIRQRIRSFEITSVFYPFSTKKCSFGKLRQVNQVMYDINLRLQKPSFFALFTVRQRFFHFLAKLSGTISFDNVHISCHISLFTDYAPPRRSN